VFGHYAYDGDGNFIRKEAFNEMIYEYAAFCDKNTGVYPLTEEMAYAIKSAGNSMGWYTLDNESLNIFGEDAANIVAENAWLFACATFEDDAALGTTAANPIELYSDGKVKATAETTYHFSLLGENVTVRITDSEGVITVYANGESYTAEGGVIEFTVDTGVTTFYLVADEDMMIEYTSNIG
jgi:hypothetical protein